MGIKFDDNGTTRDLTVADMLRPEFQESYSDLFKSLYGFRPRGYTSPEAMLAFYDGYEAAFESQQEEEREALRRISARDGVEYSSWSHYYSEKERKAEEEWERENAVRIEQAAHKAEMNRRFSPLPVIEAWEHGSI